MLLLLAACSVFEPIEGSWILLLDPNTSRTGDCAGEDDSGGEYVALGKQEMWADVYALQGNEVAVMLSSYFLFSGTYENSTLSAEYVEGYKHGADLETTTLSLEGTVSGGVMEGEVTQSQKETFGQNDYTCTTRFEFTGNRAVSTSDQHPSP